MERHRGYTESRREATSPASAPGTGPESAKRRPTLRCRRVEYCTCSTASVSSAGSWPRSRPSGRQWACASREVAASAFVKSAHTRVQVSVSRATGLGFVLCSRCTASKASRRSAGARSGCIHCVGGIAWTA
eukprot:3653737-Rhodomonas_salina.1